MINSHLVLVSLSVYTFDVSNTMFEDKESARTIFAASMATARVVMQNSHAHPDKDMVSMRILGHGTLIVGRDAGARPKPQPNV